ncbi:MAG TPA: 16S rRNA (guanine(966)-N(2))-methyltransferase RsmD [Actinobacteria bacterium]|nr:16S rRNA (guanine(966)-N(2))-methyltransferase RsmD [Actinomycetes bacterium]HEX21530.1 16S rRNA (guanine(966)-N(2))-methyltransferase RsmD [Actinomycetota bacterium]
MRIIAGIVGGHKITAPKDGSIRPTTDRVRENVFNILRDFPRGAEVLDLFAGSGALGIEALSRGAKTVKFIDSSTAAVRTINKNLAATKLAASAMVCKYDVNRYLLHNKVPEQKFNLIFLDPPYKISAAELREVFINLPNYLTDDGLLILESGRKLPEKISNLLQLVDSRHYGDTYIYIFKQRQFK